MTFLIYKTAGQSFRPLAGLSCINLSMTSPHTLSRGAYRFRPLAGLSCINPSPSRTMRPGISRCFRPLAGLSCINRGTTRRERCQSGTTFPSPRGVELHKPQEDPGGAQGGDGVFPSPRGVELHKPRFNVSFGIFAGRGFRPLAGLSCINHIRVMHRTDGTRHVFPSPRGVELHKPRL